MRGLKVGTYEGNGGFIKWPNSADVDDFLDSSAERRRRFLSPRSCGFDAQRHRLAPRKRATLSVRQAFQLRTFSQIDKTARKAREVNDVWRDLSPLFLEGADAVRNVDGQGALGIDRRPHSGAAHVDQL